MRVFAREVPAQWWQDFSSWSKHWQRDKEGRWNDMKKSHMKTLHSSSGHTFPSSALQGVHRRFTSHSYLFVRFLSSLGLSSPSDVSSTPKPCILFKPKPGYTSQQKDTQQHRVQLYNIDHRGSIPLYSLEENRVPLVHKRPGFQTTM